MLPADDLTAFIDALARAETAPDAFNQYGYTDDANAIRRHNLALYLRHIRARRPHLLLVGEAPGYRGCRLTGVPFTSEDFLVNGIAGVGLFGTARGYRKTEETAKAGREQTATIIWETLLTYGHVPLAWNAFPFHPHRAGNGWSNRTPRSAELRLGAGFLAHLMRLFPVEAIVAVGGRAEATLRRAGLPCIRVRHPAQGGKAQFAAGMAGILRAHGGAPKPPTSHA